MSLSQVISQLDTSPVTLDLRGHNFFADEMELVRHDVTYHGKRSRYHSIHFHFGLSCADCNMDPVVQEKIPSEYGEGEPLHLHVGEEPCPYTDEKATTRVTIPVPSGRLVMMGDQGNPLTLNEPHLNGKNGSLNRAKSILAWGEMGVARVWVYDSNPNLYRRTDGSLVMGWEPRLGEKPEDWEEVATVLGDGWFYSLMDLETYLLHGGEETTPFGTPLPIVQVEPGNYGFTTFSNRRSFDLPAFHYDMEPDGSVVFAEVRRVHTPNPGGPSD